VLTYLEVGALVGERGAEESGDDAHDSVGYIAFQLYVRMLAICCGVAYLPTTTTTMLYY
jgi:hypothetical protein